jgi:hypothetical protein
VEKYIQSYPKEMEGAMNKFTEAYFTENDTLEHYIRTVASSVMSTANSQEVPNNTNDEDIKNLNKEEEKQKKDDEYTGGKPTLFEEADWRQRQEEEARSARESQEFAIKRMTQISKAIQRFESKPMHKHCIPATDMINMEQARLMYNELYDDCLTEGLPLTKLTDLAANESCIPETHPETETIIDTISHAIMRRLMCFIPKTNTKMLEILGPYTKDRDGYGSLYALMRRTCSFMKPTTQGWGPEWTRTTSPSKYTT